MKKIILSSAILLTSPLFAQTTPLQANAQIVSVCQIETPDVTFGQITAFSTNTVIGAINILCNNKTSYVVRSQAGDARNSGVSTWNMLPSLPGNTDIYNYQLHYLPSTGGVVEMGGGAISGIGSSSIQSYNLRFTGYGKTSGGRIRADTYTRNHTFTITY